jgi:hypothetical protein
MAAIGFFAIAFLACAAQTQHDAVVFEEPLVYSYANMSLDRIIPIDIAKFVSAPDVDLITAIRSSLKDTNPEWFDQTKEEMVTLLGELSKRTGQSMKALFAMSGSELNALAIGESLFLSVDNVISFAELKIFLSSTSPRVYVSRKALFETALARELTQSETTGLSDFQDYLSSRSRYGEVLVIETLTEEELHTSMEALGYSEEVITSAIMGYLLVKMRIE